MSKDLTTGSTDLAQVNQDFWGNMETKDFGIPHVSIGQPTTKSKKGKPGFFNYSNGKSVERIDNVKLIVPTKTRVLYQGEGRARCKSDNYYHPSGFVKDPISQNCMTCPASQWGDRDPAKLKIAAELNVKDVEKPLCTETYNLMMADGNWMPFFAQFQKTQIKVVSEQLFSRIRYDYNRVPPYAVAFDMSLRKVESGNNNYYTVVFDCFRVVDDYKRGEDLYLAFSKRAHEILAKDHETMDQRHDQAKDVTPFSSGDGFNPDEEIPF